MRWLEPIDRSASKRDAILAPAQQRQFWGSSRSRGARMAITVRDPLS
jgi:hypothetical protein